MSLSGIDSAPNDLPRDEDNHWYPERSFWLGWQNSASTGRDCHGVQSDTPEHWPESLIHFQDWLGHGALLLTDTPPKGWMISVRLLLPAHLSPVLLRGSEWHHHSLAWGSRSEEHTSELQSLA